MLPEQEAAVADVRQTFPDHTVTATDLPDGRVWVTVEQVDAGAGWAPAVTDLSVYLTVAVGTSPYPFYAAAGLSRTDGRSFGAMSPSVQVHDGMGRAQLSLKKDYDSATEGLGARFAAVMHWLQDPK